MNQTVRLRPEPLPATLDDMLLHRQIKGVQSLNDAVEQIHLDYFREGNTQYHAFLNAVYDDDAVEGSCAADNYEAAGMIRDRAKKQGVVLVANKKKATIAKSLGVVLRRYAFSRKERRNSVGGVDVPAGDAQD